MTLAAELRARRLRPAIDRAREAYETRTGDEDKVDFQLARLNAEWRRIRTLSPYFSRLADARELPEQFHSVDAFVSTFPVTERADIQRSSEKFLPAGVRGEYRRVTGGSTGQPVQLAASRSEDDWVAPDLWYARSWYGVSPSDRGFLLWGHSHIFGTGLSGWVNRRTRQVKDLLLGYHRQSAYDLSPEALSKAGQAMIEFRPAYVLGYSVALDRFARENELRKPDFRALGIKVVIVTGEGFPNLGSRRLISNVFGCPVVMEYGAVETGPIAHETPDGEFFVFWRNHLVDGVALAGNPGRREILVTSLFPRIFPLLRYRLGDTVTGPAGTSGSILRFKALNGRCNDGIELPDGGQAHSEAITHIVRDVSVIREYQFAVENGGRYTLRYRAERELSEDEQNLIRSRFGEISPALTRARFHRTEDFQRSVSGKHQFVVRESGGK